jgi:aspartate/methionine/tyrosine aminotransferase
MISSRLPPDLSPNAVSRAVAARRAAGAPLIDLTESNPTRVGISYPPDLLAPLADPAALVYDPQPLGLPTARAAVAREYARQGLAIDPSRIALTSSTSEAYALLFKLFCDPGDRVLVPEPSYPLFDHLTRLEAVETAPYELEYHGTWRIDPDSVRRLRRCARVAGGAAQQSDRPFLHRTTSQRSSSARPRPGSSGFMFFDYPSRGRGL